MFVPCFILCNTLCPFCFCNHLDGEQRAGCFALSSCCLVIVIFSVALPHNYTQSSSQLHTIFLTITHNLPHNYTQSSSQLHTIFLTIKHNLPLNYTQSSSQLHTIFLTITYNLPHNYTQSSSQLHTADQSTAR